MAASTRSLVSSRTCAAPLTTRDTVWWETPASFATSAMTGKRRRRSGREDVAIQDRKAHEPAGAEAPPVSQGARRVARGDGRTHEKRGSDGTVRQHDRDVARAVHPLARRGAEDGEHDPR